MPVNAVTTQIPLISSVHPGHACEQARAWWPRDLRAIFDGPAVYELEGETPSATLGIDTHHHG
jgi:hypothetical protein